MYFACSPFDRDIAAAELIASFQNVLPDIDTPLHLHAIVDAGFESSLARWARNRATSVGETSSLAAIKNHLPFVVPLGEAPSAKEISRLIGAAKRNPMISFIASRTDAKGLARELQQLLIAHTDDGMRWPLRFADTRVLPVLLGQLSGAKNHHALSADISAWWWPRRDGRTDVFINTGTAKPSGPENQRLELSDKQFANMMNAAQPDAVIAQLHQACPDILDKYTPHENHGRVSAALKVLISKSFDSAELQLRWAALALSFRQSLETIPQLAAALTEARDVSELLARIDQLPDEVWAAQDSTF